MANRKFLFKSGKTTIELIQCDHFGQKTYDIYYDMVHHTGTVSLNYAMLVFNELINDEILEQQ